MPSYRFDLAVVRRAQEKGQRAGGGRRAEHAPVGVLERVHVDAADLPPAIFLGLPAFLAGQSART